MQKLYLRANVTNGRTFGGNSWKINFARISKLGKPWREINHCILRLAEYRFIFEKINNNWIPPKCLPFEAQNFRWISERRVTKWNNLDRWKVPNLEKQHQNICWQQFEQFLTLYLHNIVEFFRPTSDLFKNWSKVTRSLTMCYTK